MKVTVPLPGSHSGRQTLFSRRECAEEDWFFSLIEDTTVESYKHCKFQFSPEITPQNHHQYTAGPTLLLLPEMDTVFSLLVVESCQKTLPTTTLLLIVTTVWVAVAVLFVLRKAIYNICSAKCWLKLKFKRKLCFSNVVNGNNCSNIVQFSCVLEG